MKVKTIYIDIKGGALQNLYGDKLESEEQIEFVLRDWDNIESGDPDPVEENEGDDWEPEVYYW